MSVPPVARLALAFTAGVSWGIAGAPLWTAPLVLILLLGLPIRTFDGPTRGAYVVVALLGGVAASGVGRPECRNAPLGESTVIVGRFLAPPTAGAAPFRTVGPRCHAPTVVTSDETLRAGVRYTLRGTWMPGRHRAWFRASGRDAAPSGVAEKDVGPLGEVPWALVRWRAGLVHRIERLYGDRAPLVSALMLARREGMDRSLTESFARTGIAHLLAISGFHVGVIAGAALALLRLCRVRRRPAGVMAAAFAWAYVGLIGFPDAACRAALILALLAVSRARGRPPARWGALATALLTLLVLDPERLASPGFQLSFAGAAGLVAWGRSFAHALRRHLGPRMPRSFTSSLGAGAAATLATLPVVAWHFERVSVVGIPMTLAAAPLVSVALPGAIVSLLVDPVAPALAGFLAGGVDAILAVLERMTTTVAPRPWASVWASRPSVRAGTVGVVVATLVARHPRVGVAGRRWLVVTYVAAAWIGWPLMLRAGGWGTVEVVVLDVGQGDAIALRSPRGRWVLVDAGPAGPEEDPGGHPVVRALRARGVRTLEALVLTHADLDHIGGAAAVLSQVEVRAVYDPGLPAAKADYLNVIDAAASEGVPWMRARAGHTLALDGMTLEVLHPADADVEAGDTNEASVVLRLRYGAFDALLTGDAYKATERRLAETLTGLEVLKVGHHGSDTSTDSLLLTRARPEVALISVGRFNRYGHPAPDVLGRIRRAGAMIHRTDEAGTIAVTGRPDGTFAVREERGRAPGR